MCSTLSLVRTAESISKSAWASYAMSPCVYVQSQSCVASSTHFTLKCTLECVSSTSCLMWNERMSHGECVTGAAVGRLRLVGSFKLYVSFAKEPIKRDDILQKRPVILGTWDTFSDIAHAENVCEVWIADRMSQCLNVSMSQCLRCG